jgi:hypothetical protein
MRGIDALTGQPVVPATPVTSAVCGRRVETSVAPPSPVFELARSPDAQGFPLCGDRPPRTPSHVAVRIIGGRRELAAR